MNLFQLFRRTKPGEHRVMFIVKGSADDFNVTFKSAGDLRVVQKPHIHKGWKFKFIGHDGDYMYISAQSNKPHSDVSVMIYEDGKLVDKVTKAGDFPLVQVSGTIH